MTKSSAVEISARDRILEAAEELFARRGFAGVGMSEIAEAVGLSKSSLFHHFRTKAQLHAATVERILSQIELELTRQLAQGGTAVERLDRWVDALIDLLASTPSHARVLLRSLFEDEELAGDVVEQRAANDATLRILQQASNVLREGMAQGEL
ncbi:MAG TPA: TetR/AcrR family transcriptional regulator, partial [Chromatiales bacterium]|nr:TetR/AcrR family transcriptional regulator [Chromatiales bacterium]